MPQDVHGSVDQSRSEDRARLAPRPSIEKARDGSEQHVAPVGKAHVGDVGETKKKGSGPPAREVAFEARAIMFWSKPRKRSSSGQAVKKRMPSESNGSDFHSLKRGANSMKWMARPSEMAMQPKTMKLASTKKLQWRPQPMQ